MRFSGESVEKAIAEFLVFCILGKFSDPQAMRLYPRQKSAEDTTEIKRSRAMNLILARTSALASPARVSHRLD